MPTRLAYEALVFDSVEEFVSQYTYTRPKVLRDGKVFKNFTRSNDGRVTISRDNVILNSQIEVFETVASLQEIRVIKENFVKNTQSVKRHAIVLYKNLVYDLQEFENTNTDRILMDYAERFLALYSSNILNISEINIDSFIRAFSNETVYGYFLPESFLRYEKYLSLSVLEVKHLILISLLNGDYTTEPSADSTEEFIVRDKSENNVSIKDLSEDRPNSAYFRKIDLGQKEIIYCLNKVPVRKVLTDNNTMQGTYILNFDEANRQALNVFNNVHHFYSDKNDFNASKEVASVSHIIHESVDNKELHELRSDSHEDEANKTEDMEGYLKKTSVELNNPSKKLIRTVGSVPRVDYRVSVYDVNTITEVIPAYEIGDFTNGQGLPKEILIDVPQDGFVVIEYLTPVNSFKPWMPGLVCRFSSLLVHSDFDSMMLKDENSSYIASRDAIQRIDPVPNSTRFRVSYKTDGLITPVIDSNFEFDGVDSSSLRSGFIWIEKEGQAKAVSLGSGENVMSLFAGSYTPEIYFHETRLTINQYNDLGVFKNASKIVFISRNKIKAGSYRLSLDIDPQKFSGEPIRREQFNPVKSYAFSFKGKRPITSEGILDKVSSFEVSANQCVIEIKNPDKIISMTLIQNGRKKNFNKYQHMFKSTADTLTIDGDFTNFLSPDRVYVFEEV